jgi:hypothetical protein
LRIASERSAGVVVPQPPSNAARAAFTARSTSCCVELGAWAISSPVAGLMTGSVRPSAASTDSPSMKFLKVCVAVAIAAFSSAESGGWKPTTISRTQAGCPRRCNFGNLAPHRAPVGRISPGGVRRAGESYCR